MLLTTNFPFFCYYIDILPKKMCRPCHIINKWCSFATVFHYSKKHYFHHIIISGYHSINKHQTNESHQLVITINLLTVVNELCSAICQYNVCEHMWSVLYVIIKDDKSKRLQLNILIHLSWQTASVHEITHYYEITGY